MASRMVIDARKSVSLGDLGVVGCSSLITHGSDTLLRFDIRRWPLREAHSRIEWSVEDESSSTALAPSGVVVGTGGLADGFLGYAATCRFTGQVRDRARVRCCLDGEIVLDDGVDVIATAETERCIEISTVPWTLESRRSTTLFEDVWRSQLVVADSVESLASSAAFSDDVAIEVLALEQWGRLFRVLVHVAEYDPYATWWWTVSVDGSSRAPIGYFVHDVPGGYLGYLDFEAP